MITQTMALFVDAYRELNARRIFWITLAISLVLVLAFLLVGLDAQGVRVFRTTFPSTWFNSRVLAPITFYKTLFAGLGSWWLGFGASALALISTASIFPEFLAGGAVDLYLARPISRLRLFLTKYMAALGFVTLQVLVFTLASFLFIGIRGGEWIWPLFWAVPLVVCLFSYLFCVCALTGVLTRSTVTAILVTVLFWIVIFALHLADSGMRLFVLEQRGSSARLEGNIRRLEADVRRLEKLVATSTAPSEVPYTRQLAAARLDLASAQARRSVPESGLERWHRRVYVVKTILPKTDETAGLLARWTMSEEEMAPPEARRQSRRGEPISMETAEELQREMHSRSPAWILGTSLVFEAAVLAVAAWVFCRRDY